MPYQLSRYSCLFSKNNTYLLYNALNNGFYETNRELFDFLSNTNVITDLNTDVLKTLSDEHILVTPAEDDEYYDSIKGKFLLSSLNTSHIGLTIAPTIQCNLRCPYCFEENKPTGIMSEEIADKVVDFIKEHECALTYSITWFGGEPMLAPQIMKRILDNLAAIDNPKLFNHSIISNATLINDDVIGLFTKYPLASIQVTLDGNRQNHDKKRFTAAGHGTFDLILQNFDKAIEAWPDTHFSIRVNVDKSNFNDFFEITELIRNKYPDRKNINVYPGILRANKGCESELFFSSKDHVKFDRLLRQKSPNKCAYPSICSKGCTATNASSYVIGPKGEIYLCWEHIGKEVKIVGNINQTGFTNPKLFYRFLNHGHMFDDPECKKCGIMPICTGGCPNKRIENRFEGAKHNLCALYNEQDREVLYDILYEYFLSQKES